MSLLSLTTLLLLFWFLIFTTKKGQSSYIYLKKYLLLNIDRIYHFNLIKLF